MTSDSIRALLERELAIQLAYRSDFPAVFAFSLQKAGSSLMHSMIHQVCKREGIPLLDLPLACFHLGIPPESWLNERDLLGFFQDGRVYCGFRNFPPLLLGPGSILERRKSVLLVRDPRDALVSHYFSFSGNFSSHARPNRNPEYFDKEQKNVWVHGIDEYVMARADNYIESWEEYFPLLQSGNLMLCHYEDIYYDKHTFLGDIFSHFGIPARRGTISAVAKASDVRPQSEDPSRHIRQGEPGDHRRKLRAETIAALSRMFADTCRPFGYELG